MDTVRVTKSAGSVGAWTVTALADAGREVVAVDRRTSPERERREVVSAIDPESGIEGHEAVLIVAAENFLGRNITAAIKAARSELPAECDLDGDKSVFDYTKAKRLLGWEPAHSWRDDVVNDDTRSSKAN